MKQVFYEWDWETVEDGDVVNHNFADKLSEFHDCDKSDELVLVRDDFTDRGLDRTWAYVKDDKLPEYFQDAYQRDETRVPKRFYKEFESYLKKQNK